MMYKKKMPLYMFTSQAWCCLRPQVGRCFGIVTGGQLLSAFAVLSIRSWSFSALLGVLADQSMDFVRSHFGKMQL